MLESTEALLAHLRSRLAQLSAAPALAGRAYDAVVSHNEVNDRHGTGVLLRKLFQDHPDVLSIRSRDLHGGDTRLGAARLKIDHDPADRTGAFVAVARHMTGMRARRVVCVPYSAGDLHTALALRYLYRAPLCLYVMDDQCVTTDGIPPELMAEAIGAADLRLAISQEMAHAYEARFGHRFWLVPPVVSPQLIPATVPAVDPEYCRAGTGVLIGNVWSPRWLELLRAAVRGAGVTLHWYGDEKSNGMTLDFKALAADGIVHRGFLPQEELVPQVRRYPYSLLATSPLDGNTPNEYEGQRAIARLSLPSRLPFLMAAAHIPLLVVGSRETTAARFVERFDLGRTVGYDAAALKAAVAESTDPARQADVRARAARLAPAFSATGAGDWIWRSLARGRAADDRYERLMPRRPDEGGPAPAPEARAA
jgi:hypothetical protein